MFPDLPTGRLLRRRGSFLALYVFTRTLTSFFNQWFVFLFLTTHNISFSARMKNNLRLLVFSKKCPFFPPSTFQFYWWFLSKPKQPINVSLRSVWHESEQTMIVSRFGWSTVEGIGNSISPFFDDDHPLDSYLFHYSPQVCTDSHRYTLTKCQLSGNVVVCPTSGVQSKQRSVGHSVVKVTSLATEGTGTMGTGSSWAEANHPRKPNRNSCVLTAARLSISAVAQTYSPSLTVWFLSLLVIPHIPFG